jgi:hypothetical protein
VSAERTWDNRIELVGSSGTSLWHRWQNVPNGQGGWSAWAPL